MTWVASLLVSTFIWALFFISIGGSYSPKDVAEKCDRHNGVASVTNKVFSPGKEKALIVCRDGTIHGLKR